MKLSFMGSGGYVTTDAVYENVAQFKDAVNRFISDYKQIAFCCNVNRLSIPEYEPDPDVDHKPIVTIFANGDDDAAVSITDSRHPNVKQDGNIRVVRIAFYTIDEDHVNCSGDPYDITRANGYSYVIQ